jgi:hypothetical protein
MAAAIASVTAVGVAGWGVSITNEAKQSPVAVYRPNLMAVPPKSTPITVAEPMALYQNSAALF